MPKGIDDSVFCEYGKSNVDNLVRLISTRQLRKSYGHDIVLRAVARLRSGIPNIKYLICGDGEYRQELQKRVIELGLENIVTFLGRVDHSKLPLYLNSADVYVSMQASDGVSASLLEASACGVFPVIPDNKANRLLIRDGLNGMLVSPDDEVGLAQGIEKALKDIHRRKKAKEMNSMFIKEKYSVISNTKLVLAKYRELVEKRV
jgi:glycosyltransferase involved in cell wall biosynthesis